MINYNNPTNNEIRRIVAAALDPVEQVKILAQLTGKGEDEIRGICGMPPKTKKVRYYKRGRPNRMWTEAEEDYLRDHRNDKLKDQAAALGRCIQVIYEKRRQLGIKSDTVWTPEVVDKLVDLYTNRGYRAKMISQELKLNLYEVQKKIIAMRKAGRL